MKRMVCLAVLAALVLPFLAGCALVYTETYTEDKGKIEVTEVGLLGVPGDTRAPDIVGLLPLWRSRKPVEPQPEE